MRFPLSLVVAALCLQASAQVEITEIGPDQGYVNVRLVNVSQDGSRIAFETSESDGFRRFYTWTRGVGIVPIAANINIFDAMTLNGRFILGNHSANVDFGFDMTTGQNEDLPINLSYLTAGSNGGLLSRFTTSGGDVISTEITKYRPFNELFQEVSVPGKVLLARPNNDLNGYFVETGFDTVVFVDPFHSVNRTVRNVRFFDTSSGTPQQYLFPYHAQLFGAAGNAPIALVIKTDNEANPLSMVLQTSGGSGTTLPIVNTYGQFPGEKVPQSMVTDNGKMFVGKTRFYRGDLGVVDSQAFLNQFMTNQEYLDHFTGARFMSISGNAKLLVANGGSFTLGSDDENKFKVKKLILAYNPETFRNKTAERFRISMQIRTRAANLFDLDPDDKTRSTLECFYSLTSNLLSPTTQAVSASNSILIGTSTNIFLNGNTTFTWNVGTSQSFSITGSVSDFDQGGTNDVLLNGPFNLTLTDLRNGGKTFVGNDVSLIVSSTPLGPVLDPNS